MSPPQTTTATATRGNTTCYGLEITKQDGVCTITINNPKRRNAINSDMYNVIRDTLNDVSTDPSLRVLVLTGSGDYYSSGNDLSGFQQLPQGDIETLLQEKRDMFRDFVSAFINFPKLLVCAVNGPAVGVAVSTLALADLVYASDSATFHAPFATLGQTAEACSSYTFPKIMGYAKANEVLLAARKLTAQEAFARGLVTDVIPQNQFRDFVTRKLKYLAGLPPNAVRYGKALNRLREKETLHRVNEEECTRLKERWVSEEVLTAVMKFLSKSSKL